MSQHKGHPSGLYLLFSTEMAERFSYYGMRALFTLYMINALKISVQDASQIYGSYTGLVYLTPLIGGIVADRYWGNRKSIFWGGAVMALGQFFMFLSATFMEHMGQNLELAKMLMFIGLGFLIVGNGFFKPNISTMVGDLYEPTDKRKDSAFTIFYMGINIGATIAPLWCGWVGAFSYKWGYLSACVAMLLSITIFKCLQNKYLVTPEGKGIGLPPVREKKAEKKVEVEAADAPKHHPHRIIYSVLGAIALIVLFSLNYSIFSSDYKGDTGIAGIFAGADWIGSVIYSLCIVMPIYIITDPTLTKQEITRILVIYVIAFFVIFFWAAFEQAGASLMVFAERNTDRVFFGWEMPAEWTQSFNAIAVVCLAPVFAALWSFLGKHKMEPASPVKQAIGLFLLALGYIVIAFGVKGVDSDTKISIFWLVSLYIIHTCGELSLSPIGLSMVNKLSPARMASLLMGVWFMSTAAANKFAGLLSGLYPKEGEVKSFLGYQVTNLYDFFMIFIVMSAVAGVLLLITCPKLKKMMAGID